MEWLTPTPDAYGRVTIYGCHCGRRFETLSEATLCSLTHKRGGEKLSKVFRTARGIEFMEWLSEGVGMVGPYSNIHTEDIPALIAWLQEGPPQKQWRIIGRWDERPTAIHFNNSHIAFALEADDIEEVLE